MSEMHNLDDLLKHQLQDLYSAEQQMIKALPQMADAASAPELRQAFEEHLEVTKTQAGRLENIWQNLGDGEKITGTKCKGMEGLIEEGKEVFKFKGDPAVIDAALIAAAQRVEHYEIAGYGCARTFAEQLGYSEAAEMLQETLDEEAETDERLTQLAEGNINEEAEQGDEQE